MRPGEALAVAEQAHAATRRAFALPEMPPQTAGGRLCPLCSRECVIGEGQRGYCGLRTVRNGRLVNLAGTPARGLLTWYRDPLPTNCVADWVCRGSRMQGFHNLAVFYESCTLNCLFCQNWHFRETRVTASGISAEELASAANARTFCVCFFGGDPASQMPHALAAGRLLARRGVTVCWETAGMSRARLLDYAVELSLRSGGCVKFDLKAYDDTLHRALTGGSNAPTLENFARVARRIPERPDPPLLVASTLLVPGYVDAAEVGRIARFIASLDPSIPYALLGFAPHFAMGDLLRTSLSHAEEAEAAARAAGLTRVRIGNRHLLGADYPSVG
ncbi:MAG: radical SAM protein [Bryobacterales bacterium]|nr:radical SAM protein [Bryobacteraceae bacterium]MDW8353389.1 radical SAM protein [Bryobacterales bacterium]